MRPTSPPRCGRITTNTVVVRGALDAPSRVVLAWLAGVALSVAAARPEESDRGKAGVASSRERETRELVGWNVHVSRRLLDDEPESTERALELLETQLQQIERVVPARAVVELRRVPLYFSPPYGDRSPRAEFHPDPGWLRRNRRDPTMAGGVEFTNVRIFEAETRRMPNFALHELAHAYHFRVLERGFGHDGIKQAYELAKDAGIYDHVERWHGDGRANTFERSYAITNPMEYFAETTEAYFARNDFFPFTRQQLSRHDPRIHALLGQLWGVDAE